DSLTVQARMVAGGGLYALLGRYAVTAASKELPIRAARIVEPTLKRRIALAMSRHGGLTLAMRSVMRETQDIVRAAAAVKALA
ncbi:MAG TPA: LysR family transcriptional regulator, partial [Casimicrobiaceae bacterium]